MRTLWITLAVTLSSPAVAAPDVWLPDNEDVFSVGDGGQRDEAAWWASFEDASLTRHVLSSLESNPDLGVVADTALQLRSASRSALAPLLPQLSWDSSITAAPMETLGFAFGGLNRDVDPSICDEYQDNETLLELCYEGIGYDPDAEEPPDIYYNGQSAVSASWTLDIFGKSVLDYQAARKDFRSAESNRDAQAAAVAQLVGGAYFDLVSAKQQLALIQRQVTINEELLELVELRYERGDATALEVLQQRQTLATIRASLPNAKQSVRLAGQTLELLTGSPPTAQGPASVDELPQLPERPGLGTPAELLESRPDLAAANHDLEAARLRKLSAVRSFFPTVSVGGSAGYQFSDFGDFNSQEFWQLQGQVSVPIFGGGSRHGALQQARFAEFAARRTLSSSTLTAVGEVESAVIQEEALSEQVAAYEAQRDAARATFEESRDQYVAGLTTYVTVLQALSTWQNAELSVIQARRNLIGARISLHDALGGPWSRTPNAGGR